MCCLALLDQIRLTAGSRPGLEDLVVRIEARHHILAAAAHTEAAAGRTEAVVRTAVARTAAAHTAAVRTALGHSLAEVAGSFAGRSLDPEVGSRLGCIRILTYLRL